MSSEARQRPLIFWSIKETVYMCLRHLKRGSRFLLMGQDIQYNNVNFPGRAAASAVCLGSHAARSDYGGCDSARVTRPGSHAARGGRGGRSSASMMRVVVMDRPARCARSGRCSWRFATVLILAPHPKYYLFTRTPHYAPQAV